MSKEYIEAYPSKEYLSWRFLKCPYHNYFTAIIENIENREKIGIVWYEVFRGQGQYDIIIEYLSISNNYNTPAAISRIATTGTICKDSNYTHTILFIVDFGNVCTTYLFLNLSLCGVRGTIILFKRQK